MHLVARNPRRWRVPAAAPDGGDAASIAPLLAVLWRRRLALSVTVVACLICAAGYLKLATRVYRAVATVHVVQHAPRVFTESYAPAGNSEGFLATQARVVLSAPVLTRALKHVDDDVSLAVNSKAPDRVAWLQSGGALQVEAANKADLITVSMDATDPYEASAYANAVIKGYVEEDAERRRSVGRETVKVLQGERAQLQQKREQAVREVARIQRDRGVLSFGTNDNGNTVLQRTNALSQALTEAELASVELRAQRQSLEGALKSPAAMAAYVDSIQFRNRDSGDREFDELRTTLLQQNLALATAKATLGENHRDVRAWEGRVDLLRQRIIAKQRSMIDAQLVITNTQIAAAEERERQLRGRLEVQQKQAVEMTPDALRVSQLEADVGQIQKQCDALDARIAEVSANSIEGGPLNIEVVDWARPPQRPAFPRPALTLIAAFVSSWVVGAGVVLLREWQDTKLRATTEIVSLLQMHVLAEVPEINRRLPASVRGQIVRVDPRSRAAEAYRGIRAAIDPPAALPSPTATTPTAAASVTPTILICSPTPGDGKSTTASNLAIALANAGHRTLLIDCDLVRPVQHLIFHADPAAGLSTVAAGEGKLADAVQPTVVPGLYLLPAGPLPASPSDLLTGKRFALLMEALRAAFDRIVIDSPPLATSSDGMVLASSADATLLVVRLNQSLRDTATNAVDVLQRSGANVLGVVANDVQPPRASRRYTYPGLASTDYADEPIVVRRQRRLSSRRHVGKANGDGDGHAHGSGNGNGAAGPAAGTAAPVIVEPAWDSAAGR